MTTDGKSAFFTPRPLTTAALMLGLCFLLGKVDAAAQTSGTPQQGSCVSTNETKIATYKMIALMASQEAHGGDFATASRLSDALEVVFDRSAYCLVKRGVNSQEEEKIDHLMDLFIGPIRQANKNKTAPDAVAIEAAYQAFVAELDTIQSDVVPKR